MSKARFAAKNAENTEGKFESLRDMAKRILAQMGKSSEDAMRYLHLTDEEKQSVRQAF